MYYQLALGFVFCTKMKYDAFCVWLLNYKHGSIVKIDICWVNVTHLSLDCRKLYSENNHLLTYLLTYLFHGAESFLRS